MKYINKIEYIDDKKCRIIADTFDVYDLDTYTVSTSGIFEGTQCDDELFDRIVFDSDCIKAESEALKYLSSRMRTQKHVFERLLEKGYSDEIAYSVCDKLLSWGYIDDEAYSRAYVEYRLTNSKKAWRAIAFDLKHDGVNSDVISTILSEYDVDESERAYEIALRTVNDKRDEKTLKRLQGTLSRNGFYWDEVRYALSKLGGSEHWDEDW